MMYRYVGINKEGEKVEGEFIGKKDELISFLHKEGVILLSLSESYKKRKKGKYKIGDFLNDMEELSYLIGSGLRLDKAIQAVIKNSQKEESVKLWEDVLADVRKGNQFSQALKASFKKRKFSFDDFYINIISAGEEVGDIKNSLDKIIQHLEFKLKIRRDILSSMAYPMFLIIVSIVAIFFVAYFILPKFSSIFTPKELKEVPLISRIFMKFGIYVHNNSDMVLVLVLVFLFFVGSILYLDNVRKTVLKLIKKFPLLKNIFFEIELANLFSSLSTMIKGGVDISKALKMSKDSVEDGKLKNMLDDTIKGIKKGLKISQVWSKYSFIPSDVVSLVSAGENSASLDEIFEKMGKKYMENFKVKVSRLVTFIEPLLIVILGVFIGMIVVSIMLAVLSLTNVS